MATWFPIVKRVAAIALIAASLGFYANGRWSLTASYAVVAAPAVSIRSPGDGVLSHSVRNFSVSAAGTQIATVKPAPANDPELRAASAELETVKAEVASLENLIGLGEEMRSNTRERQTVLTRQRGEHLERLLQVSTLNLGAKEAAMQGTESTKQRSVELCAQGLMMTQECEAARTKAEIDRREFEAAQGQLEVARFLLDSTRSGADVGQDVGSEVTYARQRRDELTLRLATLKQQIETQKARAKALEVRVSPPPIAVSLSSRSRTWTVYHQTGAQVVKGEALFDVVDCDQLFVFAAVTDDRYEKLRVGMAAQVTVQGRTYAGKVAQLLGPYGTFSQDRRMQPQPPVIVNGRDASKAAVAVEVPALVSALGRSCEVGTLVEVTFTQ